MSCDKFELISAYYDGELSKEDAAAAELHLSSCDECRRFLADITAVSGACTREEVPAGFVDKVMEKLDEPTSLPKKRFKLRFTLVAALIALGMLAASGSFGNLFGLLDKRAADNAESSPYSMIGDSGEKQDLTLDAGNAADGNEPSDDQAQIFNSSPSTLPDVNAGAADSIGAIPPKGEIIGGGTGGSPADAAPADMIYFKAMTKTELLQSPLAEFSPESESGNVMYYRVKTAEMKVIGAELDLPVGEIDEVYGSCLIAVEITGE